MRITSLASLPGAKLISAWLVNIVMLLLIAAFQVNVIASIDLKVMYDIIIAVLVLVILLLTEKPSIKLLVSYMILFCIGLLFNDVLKAAYLPISVYFGYVLFAIYKESVLRLLTLVMFFNLAIIALQVSGINEIFYVQQNYYDNPGNIPFRNLFTYTKSIELLPLTQLRPSGIFPSTIYLTYFQFFLVFYYFTGNRCMGKFFYFFLSLLFVLTGSTASLLLAICVYIFGENKFIARWFFYSYLVSLTLYYLLLPSWFFRYNYSLTDFLLSIQSRLGVSITDDVGFYGMFPYLLIPLSGVALIAIFFKSSPIMRSLIFACILLFTPLIIHNTVTSPFYWSYVGGILGYYASSGKISYREIGQKIAVYLNGRKQISKRFTPKE